MRRFAQRLARLERQRQPASLRAESEWGGIPIRDLIRFMTSGERSAYRDSLIIVRDHFDDLSEGDRDSVRAEMRNIMDTAAMRVEAGERPPVERQPSIREVYEASLRSGARG